MKLGYLENNNEFTINLIQEILRSIDNCYTRDNIDRERFIEFKSDSLFTSCIKKIIQIIGKLFLKNEKICFVKNYSTHNFLEQFGLYAQYLNGFNNLYNLLHDDYSKLILVKVIAFRILGYEKVKFPLNTPQYWHSREKVSSLIKGVETIDVNFLNWKLRYFVLEEIGYLIKLYSIPLGIYNTFILKQYEFNKQFPKIKAEIGDIVIDGGGGWGDTALYFAHEVGEQGKVYTFEFISNNLTILEKNLKLNPDLRNRIEIIKQPLWEESNKQLYFEDNGPGSKLIQENHSREEKKIETITIDDFVVKNNIQKVDFIKMDIEGAELYALKGAINTIKNFKPKLAISLYHAINDFVEIPQFLSGLNLDYLFYIDHYTTYAEETILFAY